MRWRRTWSILESECGRWCICRVARGVWELLGPWGGRAHPCPRDYSTHPHLRDAVWEAERRDGVAVH
jgi:hypothetical protein